MPSESPLTRPDHSWPFVRTTNRLHTWVKRLAQKEVLSEVPGGYRKGGNVKGKDDVKAVILSSVRVNATGLICM